MVVKEYVIIKGEKQFGFGIKIKRHPVDTVNSIYLDHIFSYESLLQKFSEYAVEGYSIFNEKGLVPIGLIAEHGGLLVGVEENNMDKIWFYWKIENTFFKLSQNIFSFFVKAVFCCPEGFIQDYGINKADLYKKYEGQNWYVE